MGDQTVSGAESVPDTAQTAELCGQARPGNGNDHVPARSMGKEISALAFGRQPDLSSVRPFEKKDCFHDERPCAGKEPADKMRWQFRVFFAGF